MLQTTHIIHDQQLLLSPERCIFWESKKILILTDLHVGKSSHFRKAGIPIPQHVFQDDLRRLSQQISQFQPKIILITGDLFHSHENREHELFAAWRSEIPSIEVILVRGNHEVLSTSAYEKLGIKVYEEEYRLDSFLFSHELPAEKISGLYYFTGHVHPGVQVSGKGKQKINLPCFYFAASHCILPAFSKFTGIHFVDCKAGEKVFAIIGSEQRVVSLTDD